MAGQIIKKSENRYLIRIYQGRDANGRRRYFSRQIDGPRKSCSLQLCGTWTPARSLSLQS